MIGLCNSKKFATPCCSQLVFRPILLCCECFTSLSASLNLIPVNHTSCGVNSNETYTRRTLWTRRHSRRITVKLLTLTLIFDFSTQNHTTCSITQGHSLHQFEHFGIIRFWVMRTPRTSYPRRRTRHHIPKFWFLQIRNILPSLSVKLPWLIRC